MLASMLPWTLALPALLALGLALGRPYLEASHAALLGNVAFLGSFALSVALVIGGLGDQGVVLTWTGPTWFTLQSAGPEHAVRFALRLDGLSAVLLLVINGIGATIALFSASYMRKDPGILRFFACLALFLAMMNCLVLADTLPLLFLGWEGVGLASYLLIGFWFDKPAYAAAAQKAFVVNRIGDLGLLLAMLTLFLLGETLTVSELTQADFLGAREIVLGGLRLSRAQAMMLVAFGLLVAAAGKSAQLPLQGWLPDAMAGPTPVSALIHAATMVTAGVYLVARFSGVFASAPAIGELLALLGALTALVGALAALAQRGLKRVLAYSTMSQLGFMLAVVGIGAHAAAVFHVFTHAFFKALLFLSAGGLMHAAHVHADLELTPQGKLKRLAPMAHLGLIIGLCALAGVPLLSGFFSKEAILGAAFGAQGTLRSGPLVFGLLAVASVLTAFYSVRTYRLLFPKAQAEADEASLVPTESWEERLALGLLAVGALFAGLVEMESVGLPVRLFSPLIDGSTQTAAHSIVPLLVGLGAFALGAAAGFSPLALRQPSETVRRILGSEAGLRPVYAFVSHMTALKAQTAAALDTFLFTTLPMTLARGLSALGARVVHGLRGAELRDTVGLLAVGLLVLIAWQTTPAAHFESEAVGSQVQLTAATGSGFTYRWDVTGDGVADTDWRKTPSVKVAFRERALVGLRFVGTARGADWQEELSEHRAQQGWVLPSTTLLAGAWCTEPTDCLPPVIRFDEGRYVLRANDAHLLVNGKRVEETHPVTAGDKLVVGGQLVSIEGLAPVKLEVRNALGITASHRELVPLPAFANAQAQDAEAHAQLHLPETRGVVR